MGKMLATVLGLSAMILASLSDYAITLHLAPRLAAPGHASPGSQPAPAARLAEDIAAQLALPLDAEPPMPAEFAAVG